MQPFAESTSAALSMIRYVLTDIDETLTYCGSLSGQNLSGNRTPTQGRLQGYTRDRQLVGMV
jgi:hypothetical protein